ncbi:MAG: precorrin-6y C5,15-methyltransferase (decarboxylating) subunit CbiE [Sneathiella sp.]|nr:precorrin-6y C5,15-methyltransferase (decarboxylating) subunit CbiE [Sneathiella sp.]
MTAWLNIIGVGDDGLGGLNAPARAALDVATLIIGGDRHLSMLPDNDKRPRLSWPSPLIKLVEDVLARRGENICILATGDPMHYGIGVTFAKRLSADEMAVYPALSAFSLAASRLGWDLSCAICITLHGRPLELLIPNLVSGARIFALSDNGQTPLQVAKLLTAKGFGNSKIIVLEHMGGPKEAQITELARDWSKTDCEDLNTVAIECVADPDALQLSSVPGLPDEAFAHDGQLTKKEIRSATLSALSPCAGQLLWDIGAGSGSIGIEWMRSSLHNQAIAIESREDRLQFIEKNRTELGTPGLKIISGKAPKVLQDLPAPDAVFIGGGLTADGVFNECWNRLKSGGILVANVVTLEGESFAFSLYEKYTGTLTQLSFARAHKIGGFTSWKPARQITQIKLVKE